MGIAGRGSARRLRSPKGRRRGLVQGALMTRRFWCRSRGHQGCRSP